MQLTLQRERRLTVRSRVGTKLKNLYAPITVTSDLAGRVTVYGGKQTEPRERSRPYR